MSLASRLASQVARLPATIRGHSPEVRAAEQRLASSRDPTRWLKPQAGAEGVPSIRRLANWLAERPAGRESATSRSLILWPKLRTGMEGLPSIRQRANWMAERPAGWEPATSRSPPRQI